MEAGVAVLSRLLGVVRRWRGDHAAYVLLIVSLSINVLLTRERGSRDRRTTTDELVGTVIPAVSVKAADGTAATLTWNDRDTIVYYFHPDCGWCERNVDAVAALERQTRGRFDVVAVTTAMRDSRPKRLPVTTYWAFNDGERRRLHLSGTPQTLVVARGGRVLQTFAGAYTGNTKGRVERFFQVELPEIPRPPQSVR
jgi:hypothetical protein